MVTLNEEALRELPFFEGLEPGALQLILEKMQEVSQDQIPMRRKKRINDRAPDRSRAA